MSLAERATTPKKPIHGTPCSVGELLATLDKAEAHALRTMLDAPWRVWPHLHVEEACRAEGHPVGQGQVGQHRRQACRCFKDAS
jgi:hypothetical protein